MISKVEIIERIARQRIVEQIAMNIAKTAMTDDLSDLCQIIYLALLETDEKKICSLFTNGQLHFYIARVVDIQWNGHRTTFKNQITSFRDRCDAITETTLNVANPQDNL